MAAVISTEDKVSMYICFPQKDMEKNFHRYCTGAGVVREVGGCSFCSLRKEENTLFLFQILNE